MFSDSEWNSRFQTALKEVADSDFSFKVEHQNRPTSGPRMSGLGSCGRKQVYSATNMPVTNPRNPVDNWPSLLGGVGQYLSAAVLRQMGYALENEEAEVSLADGLITGHIDGEMSGLDLEDEIAILDVKFRNVWGLFGTKASSGLVTEGLPYASADIELQLQSYMAARGRKRAIITAHPFDMSVTKQQAAIKKLEAQPAYRIVMEADPERQALALQRGMIVGAAAKLGLNVTPEFDPMKDSFPCGWCEWKAKCISDGPAAPLSLPELPRDWKMAPTARQLMEAS